MTRFPAFSSPLLLGFEEIEQAVDRLSKASGDGYPPYNIERVAGSGPDGEVLRITLAVAGFGEDDLDISVEENELVIRGRQKEDETPRVFLHRGIAARQFQRSFVLAEGIRGTLGETRGGPIVDRSRQAAGGTGGAEDRHQPARPVGRAAEGASDESWKTMKSR